MALVTPGNRSWICPPKIPEKPSRGNGPPKKGDSKNNDSLCWRCNESGHGFAKCPVFKASTMAQNRAFLSRARRCWSCLRKLLDSHTAENCTKNKKFLCNLTEHKNTRMGHGINTLVCGCSGKNKNDKNRKQKQEPEQLKNDPPQEPERGFLAITDTPPKIMTVQQVHDLIHPIPSEHVMLTYGADVRNTSTPIPAENVAITIPTTQKTDIDPPPPPISSLIIQQQQQEPQTGHHYQLPNNLLQLNKTLLQQIPNQTLQQQNYVRHYHSQSGGLIGAVPNNSIIIQQHVGQQNGASTTMGGQMAQQMPLYGSCRLPSCSKSC